MPKNEIKVITKRTSLKKDKYEKAKASAQKTALYNKVVAD